MHCFTVISAQWLSAVHSCSNKGGNGNRELLISSMQILSFENLQEALSSTSKEPLDKQQWPLFILENMWQPYKLDSKNNCFFSSAIPSISISVGLVTGPRQRQEFRGYAAPGGAVPISMEAGF